jgi:hypothetical protein
VRLRVRGPLTLSALPGLLDGRASGEDWRDTVSRPKAERPAPGWRVEDISEDEDEPKGSRWSIGGPGLSDAEGSVLYSTDDYRTKEAAIRATYLWAAYIAAKEALRDYNREWALDQEERF